MHISKKSGVSKKIKNCAGEKLKLPKLESPMGIRRVGMSELKHKRTGRSYSFLTPQKQMQKEAGSAWSFPETPNAVLQQVLQPSNSNQCPRFMLPPPFQRISHPPDQDQPNNKWK